MLRQTPPMLSLENAPEEGVLPAPDWRYRIDYVLGEKSNRSEVLLAKLATPPDPDDRDAWLKVFSEALKRHRDYAQKWGDGLEMIGKNNLAELRLQWEGASTLAEALSESATSVRLADSTGFPDAPFQVIVGGERLTIGALDRVGHVCSEIKRGELGTTAAAHAAGAAVAVAKTAVQMHWWRLTDTTPLHPLTTYRVSLEYDDPRYPQQER
jgi:hypothetical protein